MDKFIHFSDNSKVTYENIQINPTKLIVSYL